MVGVLLGQCGGLLPAPREVEQHRAEAVEPGLPRAVLPLRLEVDATAPLPSPCLQTGVAGHRWYG